MISSGMLHGVTALMGSYCSSSNRRAAVYFRAKIDSLVGRIVMVRHKTIHRSNFYVIYHVVAQHFSGNFSAGKTRCDRNFGICPKLAFQDTGNKQTYAEE